eukprot:IDg15953t1
MPPPAVAPPEGETATVGIGVPWNSAILTSDVKVESSAVVRTTTTAPTMRDRAYSFVMQLPVTRVRDMCREAGLKQFDADAHDAWTAALPGLREWLAAPHRDHATVWLAAPPRSLRPHNFHSFYASPSLAARRTAGAPPPKVLAVDDERDEPDAALADGERPSLRDKVYTYVRSLPVTHARRYCKALGLKQFGVKRDSQLRLFWNWAIVADAPPVQLPVPSPSSAPDPPPTGSTSPSAPADATAPLPGLADFLSDVTPERWLRAPDDALRPDAVGLRV